MTKNCYLRFNDKENLLFLTIKMVCCLHLGVRQRSGTKSLQRPRDSSELLSEFVGRTFDGFHFLIRFGVWKEQRLAFHG